MIKKIALFGILVLVSCRPFDKGKIFEEVVAIPSDGWPAAQSYNFNMPVTDTTKAYDLLIHFRNTGRYAYNNVWFFIESTSPKGNSVRDTFEIELADQMGRWHGKGIGDVNNMLVPYKQNFMFPLKGIYRIKITQAMREETLKEVLDLGIRLQIHK